MKQNPKHSAGRRRRRRPIKRSTWIILLVIALAAIGAAVFAAIQLSQPAPQPSLEPMETVDDLFHRVAAAIAATACTVPVTVLGAQCVQKSYPDFWEVYKNLGGDIHVL